MLSIARILYKVVTTNLCVCIHIATLPEHRGHVVLLKLSHCVRVDKFVDVDPNRCNPIQKIMLGPVGMEIYVYCIEDVFPYF